MQVFKIFILFLFLLIPNVSLSASFDCEKATTDTEKEICRDNFISVLDETVSKLFTQLKEDPLKRQLLIEDQKKWLKERDDCHENST